MNMIFQIQLFAVCSESRAEIGPVCESSVKLSPRKWLGGFEPGSFVASVEEIAKFRTSCRCLVEDVGASRLPKILLRLVEFIFQEIFGSALFGLSRAEMIESRF